MLENTPDVRANDIELRKTVLSHWVNVIGAGLLAVGIVICFFLPRLRDWTIIVPFVIVALMLARRAMAIRQFAQKLEEEIVQLKRDASAQAGTWPPAPKRPPT